MCQLCMINTGDGVVNKVLLSTLLQIDSASNFHGTGFLSVSKEKATVYKTKTSADNLGDLGLDINEFVTGNLPVFGHVRAASKGMDVTDANAHPFEGDRFILAHNGRLYRKDDIVTYTATDDVGLASDSLEFLKALESKAHSNPKQPFLEVINMVMDEHKGKFALMIYDKKTKKFYVCRGDSAELHIAHIRDVLPSGDGGPIIGFVVNTKKIDLDNALSLAMPICQIVSNRRLYAEKTETLEKNTVYEVKGSKLVQIGKMEERPVVFTQPSIQKSWNSGTDVGSVNLFLEIWALSARINKFMMAHRLTISDIDVLMLKFCTVPMSEALISDLDLFVNVVIPKLSAPKKIREKLDKATDEYFQVYPSMYKQVPELEYPWMLSTPDAIAKMFKTIADLKRTIK